MTGLVCRITLLGVGGLLVAGTALAALPDPAHSILPKVIYVVGQNATGGVDPYGTFTVTIRDFANQPVANAAVKFDFTNCNDGALCLNAVAPGVPNCAGVNKEVNVVTDPMGGEATLTIQGGRKAPAPTMLSSAGSPPGPGAGCVQIFANGMPMGNASAVYVNQKFLDGSNVNGADTSVEQAEVVCAGLGAPYRARHDLRFDGVINGGDTSSIQVQVIRAALGTGTSLGCSNICPN